MRDALTGALLLGLAACSEPTDPAQTGDAGGTAGVGTSSTETGDETPTSTVSSATVSGSSSSSSTSGQPPTSTTSTTMPESESGSTATTDTDDPMPTTRGRWEPFASLPAGPRQETSVLALDGRVYVLGGFMGTTVVDLVERYDPAAESWDTTAPLPEAMHHINAAAIGGRIYVAGFLQTLQFTANARMFVYDPDADSWSDGTELPPGREAGSSGVAVSDGRMFVFGGLQGSQPVATAQYFDPATDSWTPIADVPGARDHLVGASVDDQVFAVGGRGGGIGSHTTEVLVYDEAADSWDVVASLPTSRGGMSGAVLRGWIFVAGGEGNAALPSGVFEEHEAYDPMSDTWHTLEPMLTPRHGTGAATVGDRVYVPGGAITEGFGPTDICEVWIPAR